MKQANKKLKDYNHNVAHELKTPLAVMKSNLELLEM
jgi:signal transduction histidine kinase